MRRPGGVTVIELLASLAVFALLLTTALQILVNGMGAWSRTMSRSDEENTVLVAMSKLNDHLTKTDANSLVLYADAANPITGAAAVEIVDNSPGAAVSFLSSTDLLPLDPSGFTQWTQFEIWYMGPDPDLTCVTGQSLWVQQVSLPLPLSFPVPFRLTSFGPKASDHRVLTNLMAVQATAPLSPTILNVGNPPTTRISPVDVQFQVKWNGHIITQESAAIMLGNCRLEPPLPTIP